MDLPGHISGSIGPTKKYDLQSRWWNLVALSKHVGIQSCYLTTFAHHGLIDPIYWGHVIWNQILCFFWRMSIWIIFQSSHLHVAWLKNKQNHINVKPNSNMRVERKYKNKIITWKMTEFTGFFYTKNMHKKSEKLFWVGGGYCHGLVSYMYLKKRIFFLDQTICDDCIAFHFLRMKVCFEQTYL